MEKFIEELDKLFEKYEVEEADRARIGDLLAGIGGELNNEGEDFEAPEMGESDGNDEEDEFED
jgi:hypothetical protein